MRAWTSNGGLTWRHASVAGITTATGGNWNRASDPVLGFAPDGNVYLHWEFHRDPYDACSTRNARPFLPSSSTGSR